MVYYLVDSDETISRAAVTFWWTEMWCPFWWTAMWLLVKQFLTFWGWQRCGVLFGGQRRDYLMSSFNFLVDRDVVSFSVDSDVTISRAIFNFFGWQRCGVFFGGPRCDYLMNSFNFLVDSDVVCFWVDSDVTVCWTVLSCGWKAMWLCVWILFLERWQSFMFQIFVCWTALTFGRKAMWLSVEH